MIVGVDVTQALGAEGAPVDSGAARPPYRLRKYEARSGLANGGACFLERNCDGAASARLVHWRSVYRAGR